MHKEPRKYMSEVLYKDLSYYLETTRLVEMKAYLQHGQTNCLMHSVAVAYYSIKIAKKFKISVDDKALVFGALFHDYFLYDWHSMEGRQRWHGFRHPFIAARNASKIKVLSQIEKDIITKHMFPLTFRPPRYKESMIVCIVDKYCSTREIFIKRPYKKIRHHIPKSIWHKI